MNLLITSGMDHRWCHYAHSQLLKMGLASPDRGEQTGIGPEQLTKRMQAAYPAASREHNGTAPVKPGKAWELAASDLILSNTDKPLWGWCSPGNVHFLDFWSEFEPNARFVLIYGAAHEALSQLFCRDGTSLDGIETYVSDWMRYHERLLQFYQINSDRSALIHIREFDGGGAHIVDCLNDRFGVALHAAGSSEPYQRSALDEMIARNVTENAPLADSLFEELNNSADIPSVRSNTASADDSLSAVNELTDLRSSLNELHIARAETEGAKAELVDTRAMLETTNAELSSRMAQFEEAKKTSDMVKSQNSLLAIQLQQLTDELEHGESRGEQTGAGQSNLSLAGRNSAAPGSGHVITIDMTSVISGQGWHCAEPHGRWAGASPRSVLRVPKLNSGRYELTARIVDTMSLQHLEQLSVLFDGHQLQGRLKVLSDVGGRLAPLRRMKATLQKVPKPVPAEFAAEIPAEWIAHGNNAHLISFSSASSIRPSESGADDQRQLSICLERVELRELS